MLQDLGGDLARFEITALRPPTYERLQMVLADAKAAGRPFGEAASQGRKHLAANPERWVGLEPRPLQDWFVPVIYEAVPMPLLPAVEFARWYAMTGGLGPQPVVLFTSFEQPIDLDDALNQVGQIFGPLLQANGIEWHALNRPGQRRQLVMQFLRQFPVLWIWDNVEPVAGFPAGTKS